jgi:hypothetical protein
MRRNLLFVGVLALLAGCSSGTVTPQINLPTAAQLRAVPLSLGVAGTTLKGETAIWRDMSPVVTLVGEAPPKRGIIVSYTVTAEESAAIPGGLRAERITVARGEDVWTSTEVEIRSSELSFGGVVRNGPEWTVGSSLDVVIDFRDSSGGKYQLRTVGQIVSGAY